MTKIRFLKRSRRKKPKLSLILLDWNVRESLHLLHYLQQQTAPRDQFEITVIEFYEQVSEAVKKFENTIDNLISLGMSKDCYYHKHVMYNVGIAFSRGDIIMIGDSDAMVRDTFVETILDAFDDDPNIVFHMDQFRNMRRDLYPFNYPEFEEVTGDGCTNNMNGQTSGVLNTDDPIHTRNYGACMCAWRKDLIVIGGSDEHIDYLGHICGPYEMTFRLLNLGRREVWHQHEFMYHTWHPGQAGADNYLGPHDGRHMSTTALETLESRRTAPLCPNAVLHEIGTGRNLSDEEMISKLIDPKYPEEWKTENIEANVSHRRWSDYIVPMGTYNGFRITAEVDRLIGRPILEISMGEEKDPKKKDFLEDENLETLRNKINRNHPPGLLKEISRATRVFPLIISLSWMRQLTLELLVLTIRAVKNHDQKSFLNFIGGIGIFFRKLLRSPREIWKEISGSKGEHGSLAVTIYYQSRETNEKSPHSKPLVFASHPLSKIFLQNLQRRPYFPEFDFIRTSNAKVIEDVLEKLCQDETQRPVIVRNDLYARFHTIFSESTASDRIVVI